MDTPIFVSEWLGIHISLCLKLSVAAVTAATAGISQEEAMATPTVYLLTTCSQFHQHFTS